VTRGQETKRHSPIILALLCLAVIPTPACARDGSLSPTEKAALNPATVNLDHFEHLFTEIEVGGKTVGVINIYSEYPDYAFAIEPAEGFACVDDAARAIVMLSGQPHDDGYDEETARKAELLIEFVLHMQNANGYFNNFLWPDGSINTSYRTSLAELNWWSFRALWALESAHQMFPSDQNLTRRIDHAIDKLFTNIKRDIPVAAFNIEVVNTIEVPTWLPQRYAADQAAVAIIALLPYFKRSGDDQVLPIINALAAGIMQMQKGDANHYPYGMFLSWKNLWHSWGNSQAYALLLAGDQLQRPDYTRSALLEIDNFIPYLLESGFFASILIIREPGGFAEESKTRFPQIAYGLRPMVYAATEAFRLTGDAQYLALATRLRSWFFGENDAARNIYDQESGRTYDAINSASEVNFNSGAESTIEGLLVMQQQ
jgi:hypothetical protein